MSSPSHPILDRIRAGLKAVGLKAEPLVLPHVVAEDFSRPSHVNPYHFGVSSAAAGLRKLADNIDASLINPQSIEIKTNGSIEDFYETTLTFKYNEKRA